MTRLTSSSLKHKSPQLFSKTGVFLLYIGIIGMFFSAQLVGIYLAAPYVLNMKALSALERIGFGGLDGTVTSLSMIFTFFIMSSAILFILLIQLNRLARHAKQTTSRTNNLNDIQIDHDINQSDKNQIFDTKYDDKSTKSLNSVESNFIRTVNYQVYSHKLKYIFHYLGFKAFSLKTAFFIILLWLLFVLVTELSTYYFDLNPTEFIDVLYDSADPKWLLICAVVILAPIYEELIFRGILWSAIVEQFDGKKGFWTVTIITSVLFAVTHLQYDVYEMSMIFLLALLLSFARAKSGSLFLPILIHILNNSLAMWMYIYL